MKVISCGEFQAPNTVPPLTLTLLLPADAQQQLRYLHLSCGILCATSTTFGPVNCPIRVQSLCLANQLRICLIQEASGLL